MNALLNFDAAARGQAIIQPSPIAVKTPRLTQDVVQRVVNMGLQLMTGRADANETVMVSRQLTQMLAAPFQARYPDIKWRDVVPVNREINTGARAHTYMLYDELGQADIVSDYGGEFPNADVVGTETVAKIYSVGAQYSYSVQDLRSAQFAGVPLDMMKGVTARHIIERKLDALCAVGDTRYGLTGFANDGNLTATTKGSQASGTTWATATPDEILRDITLMYEKVLVTLSAGAHMPDTLLVGTGGWAAITSRRLDSFNMTTIYDYLMRALPWLKAIKYWPRLDKVATSGTKERIMLCEMSSKNVEAIIAQDFEQFPPQPRNLAFVINCHVRFGGVSWRYPKAATYMDGTQP